MKARGGGRLPFGDWTTTAWLGCGRARGMYLRASPVVASSCGRRHTEGVEREATPDDTRSLSMFRAFSIGKRVLTKYPLDRLGAGDCRWIECGAGKLGFVPLTSAQPRNRIPWFRRVASGRHSYNPSAVLFGRMLQPSAS